MVMEHSSCDWVRERLALFVGDSDDLLDETGDLSSEERIGIESHLSLCSACRSQCTGLEQAMLILCRVAAEPWNGPSDPSIWPGIEAEIQHRSQRPRPAWEGFLGTICPKRLRVVAVNLGRSLERVRTEAPLQIAWTRDSLIEALQRRPQVMLPHVRSAMAASFRSNHNQLVFGCGAVVALIVLLALAASPRRTLDPRAQPFPDAAPVASLEGVSQTPLEQKMDVINVTEPVTNSRASNSLAQSEDVASLEPRPAGPTPTPVKAVATATSETTSAPATSGRYDFYLEHGTPMPPESRGGKSAY
jgi:hypothetical protein